MRSARPRLVSQLWSRRLLCVTWKELRQAELTRATSQTIQVGTRTRIVAQSASRLSDSLWISIANRQHGLRAVLNIRLLKCISGS